MASSDGSDLEGLKQRSPAFPYISLDLAIERVHLIYKNIRDTPQPREQVAKAYGKPVSSSATIQTFATLLQYGLLENAVVNGNKRLKVSILARTIVHPNAPKDQVESAIKKSALLPAIFKELWDLYGTADDVSGNVPLFYLTHDRESVHGAVFTERAAQDVLRVYRATLAFAGVSSSAHSRAGVEESDEWDEANPQRHQSVDPLATPRDESPREKPPTLPIEERRIDMSLGEREIQTGMLSKTATFRVIVSGKVGKKEIEMLIKKLEVDKELFSDDDEAEKPPTSQ